MQSETESVNHKQKVLTIHCWLVSTTNKSSLIIKRFNNLIKKSAKRLTSDVEDMCWCTVKSAIVMVILKQWVMKRLFCGCFRNNRTIVPRWPRDIVTVTLGLLSRATVSQIFSYTRGNGLTFPCVARKVLTCRNIKSIVSVRVVG